MARAIRRAPCMCAKNGPWAMVGERKRGAWAGALGRYGDGPRTSEGAGLGAGEKGNKGRKQAGRGEGKEAAGEEQ
ncbi:hypothetical protein E2562_024278 [Oryza meyeriana var. granulata]|uniref:Uncharacterized protein n=1 Tax=Oryza meyeriana var. granulata TaxID=110450 RepID=A0A6G1C9W7_9ORYZ|nr:hypothetical protein E2562_024278 [Oryza meyeriana var. granulata]